MLGLLAAPVQAERYRLNVEGAVRVGLFDPHPRVCGGAELTQRDLRVARMAFGISRDPAARWSPPWYLESIVKKGEEPKLRLRTEALWGITLDWLDGAEPGQPAGPADPLARWRRALAEALALPSGDRRERGETIAELRLTGEPGPFAWSRLHGSALLPRVEGWRSSALGEECPAWPRGVWLQPAEGDLRYVLTVSRPDRGAPFVLSAYRRESALWSDFRRGRLEVVLLEGEDVTAARLPADANIVWGVETGTQQILLRPAPKLLEELGRDRWTALSQSLPRGELSQFYGPGRIAPARGFLTPLLRKRGEPPPALQENPRDARRTWLGAPVPRARITLATIAHPVLEGMARRIGEHFQRTLNLKTSVVPLPVDGFAESLAAWQHDLYLTVYDLDDGSLQDLWEETLAALGAFEKEPGEPALTERRLAAWEQALAKALPYLPVAENVHYALAKDSALLRAVCPACEVPVRPPQGGPSSGAPPAESVVPPEG